MSSPIPTFYRICFTILDPLLASYGIYANIFDPAAILSGFTPKPLIPPMPETTVVLYGMAGFFTMLVLIEGVLLRLRPNDLVVWRCVQAGVFFQDVFMLTGFLVEMKGSGRLDSKLWLSRDWANVSIYAVIAALRSSFVLGLGVGGSSEGKTKSG